MSAARNKKPSGCLWASFFIVLILLGLSLAMNMGLLMGRAMGGGQIAKLALERPKDEFPQFVTEWSYGTGDTLAVRIPLDGLIMREPVGGLFSAREDKIEVLLRRIRAAHNDPAVRAIILEVNSPGGAITPTDEIYAALLRFRESSADRRIVVFMRDVAASGGYYAAMAGDWLIAEPTSLVGSIGVIMQMLNWHELSERIGISQTSVQSGGNKDLMNPFRPTSDEEIAILQELVDSMHDRFTGIVQEQRGLDDAAMGQVADGRIMDSARALQDGLIDEIGYWDDAVRRTAVVLGVPSVRVVRYETRTDWSTWFASVRSPMAWRSLWSEAQQPQMLYLWQP